MGRPSNRDERRAQIVAGLLEVMALHGYEAASVTEVARAAGLTPGLVHYHFKSKQEILIALVQELSARLAQRIERRLAKAEGAEARLGVVVDAHLSLAQRDPQALACWVAIGAEAIRQPRVGEAYRAALTQRVELFTQLFRQSLAARGSGARGAKASAAGVCAMIEGYYQLAAAAPGLIPRGSAASATRRAIEGLLKVV